MGHEKSSLIGLIISDAINTIFHTFGLFLLISTCRNNHITQHILLINLSVCMVLKNFLYFLHDLLKCVGDGRKTGPLHVFIEYVHLVSWRLMFYLYWLSMVFITADRLAATVFSLKYRVLWGTEQTKKVLLYTWIAAFGCLV